MAEMGVLGSMLRGEGPTGNRACELAAERLQAESFYHLAHQDIFRAAVALWRDGKDPDPILLIDRLRSDGKLDEVGGISYVLALNDAVATAANVEHYIAIVQEKAALRALLDLRHELTVAYSPTAELTAILVRLEDGLDAMVADAHRGRAVIVAPVGETLQEINKELDARAQGQQVGLETGIRRLDRLTGGLRPGWLCVIGGRPREGKTTLATNIALHVILRLSLPVVFFSAEMGRHDLLKNMLRIESQASPKSLLTGKFDQREYSAWQEACATLQVAKDRLLVDDTPAIDIDDLLSRSQQLVQAKGVRLVIVDYLQIVRTSIRAERNLQVAHITQELKRLAREAAVPVLVLSQITRPGRDSSSRHDLKWSGEIEEATDVVLLIGRDDKYAWGSEETEPDEAVRRFKLVKNRHGPEGTWLMTFDKPHLTFREASDDSAGARRGDAGLGAEGVTTKGSDDSAADRVVRRARESDADRKGNRADVGRSEDTGHVQKPLTPEPEDVPEDEIPF